LGNSVIGRQFLMNLIHTLHPHATFDDDDEDDNWIPRRFDLSDAEDDDDFEFLPHFPFRVPTVGPGTDSNDPINLVDEDEGSDDIVHVSRNHRENSSDISNNRISTTEISPIPMLVDVEENDSYFMPRNSIRLPRRPLRRSINEDGIWNRRETSNSLERNDLQSSSEIDFVDLTGDDEPKPTITEETDGPRNPNESRNSAGEITRIVTTGSTSSNTSDVTSSTTSTFDNSNSNNSSRSGSSNNNSSSVPNSLDCTSSFLSSQELPPSMTQQIENEKTCTTTTSSDIFQTKLLSTNSNNNDNEDDDIMGDFGVRLGRSNMHREYQRRRQRPRQLPMIFDDSDEI
jgi:hypothetical protein